MAEREVRAKFVFETSRAVESLEKIRESVNQAKIAISALRDASKESFEVIKTAMMEMAKQSEELRIKQLSSDPAKVEEAARAKEMSVKRLADLNRVLGMAINELKQQEQSHFEVQKQQSRESIELMKARERAQMDYVRAVQSGNMVITESMAEEGKKLQELADKVKELARTTGESYQSIVSKMVNVGQITPGTGNALLAFLNQGKSAASGFSGVLSLLGTRLLGIVGTVIGLSLSLKSLADNMRSATAYALEYAKSWYMIGVGVNALRRSGVEITVKDIAESIRGLRKEFKVFSEVELAKGSAALLNLVRDFGFTKDQIITLQRAIATLAVVNGRAMDDVQRTVALALSSGYTEGLQRLGVSINRVTIAMQAARMGFGRTYMELTEQQRALATYELILQKVKKYQDDLMAYYETAPGKIDRLKAAVKDLGTTIGAFFIEPVGEAAGTLADLVENIDKAIKAHYRLKQAVSDSNKETESSGSVVQRLVDSLLGYLDEVAGFHESNKEIIRGFWYSFVRYVNDLIAPLGNLKSKMDELGISLDRIRSVFSNLRRFSFLFPSQFILGPFYNVELIKNSTAAFSALFQTIEDGLESLNRGEKFNFFKEFSKNLDEIYEKWQEKGKSLWTDIPKDMAEMLREADVGDQTEYLSNAIDDFLSKFEGRLDDFRQRAVDIWMRYWERLEEIEIEYAERLEDASIEFFRRQDDIWSDYYQKLEDLAIWESRKRYDIELWYHQAVADANREYNQKILDEEKDYLRRLKELRERFLFDLEDALRERDAKQVLQLIRRYRFDRERLAEQHEQNLEDLRLAHQRELEEIRLQRQRKLEDLRAELAERRAEINLWLQRELEDLRLWYERRLKEIERWRERELQEAERDRQRDLDRQAKKLAIEVKMLYDAFVKKHNLTGTWLKAIYNETQHWLDQLKSLWEQYSQSIQNIDITPDFTLPPPSGGGEKGHAEGGVVFANRPTRALFGEAGPELAIFIPLNKRGNFELPIPSARSSMKVEIFLSPGLEYRIVDRTLERAAKEFVSVVRGSR